MQNVYNSTQNLQYLQKEHSQPRLIINKKNCVYEAQSVKMELKSGFSKMS